MRTEWKHLSPAASIALSLLALAGCTASGVPRFVKFSPDSSRLVYEDSCYGRVYTLDLATDTRHVFHGTAACVDSDIERMVLIQPANARFWAPSSAYLLVPLADGAPTESHLPPLPHPPERHSVFLEFGPGPDELSAVMYASLYFNSWNTPIGAYRLTLGADHWTALQPADSAAFGPLSYRRVDGPGGIWNSGHVYCPTWERAEKGSPKKVPGIDIQEAGTEPKRMYVLSSPDQRYVVHIADANDPWRRVTLTELATGRKEIVLDKDDAASDVFRTVMLPFNILLQPVMWPIAAFLE